VDAAACAPDRFLDLVVELVAEGYRREFSLSILRGAAMHLQYRFDGLRLDADRWRPEEPLPDGPGLAERIMGLVERYPAVWDDEWTAARVLQGSVAAVDGSGAEQRLVWLLMRLAGAVRPEAERIRFDRDKRTEIEARDLMMDAVNEPRGIAAGSAMRLASRLTERGTPWPELLRLLLLRFASDPVASVRAAILRDLAYLHSKEDALGWALLERCLDAPHPALWELAGETLYYQIHARYDRIAGYLDRMPTEAPGPADGTWVRLSTLALLEGHLDADCLFRRLQAEDRAALWHGAVAVFSANIGRANLAAACRSGLLRVLDFGPSTRIDADSVLCEWHEAVNCSF